MAARQPKPQPNPEAAGQGPRTALVASGEVRGVTPGTVLDRDKLAVAMAETLSARASQVPTGERGSRGRDVLVASANWADQYPEDRRLAGQDVAHNNRVFDQALNAQALVATGGICAPVNVDWSIGMVATADRPLPPTPTVRRYRLN
jgi:hypothetical protein